jgi:hypothetical protein
MYKGKASAIGHYMGKWVVDVKVQAAQVEAQVQAFYALVDSRIQCFENKSKVFVMNNN